MSTRLWTGLWQVFARPPSDARAYRFLEVYRDSGGPLATDRVGFLVPWIREHLRYEIRRDIGIAEAGGPADEDYAADQVEAFLALRRTKLL